MDEVELENTGTRESHLPSLRGSRRAGMFRRRYGGDDLKPVIRELLRDHPRGLTAETVGRLLSLSRTTAARHLDALARERELEVEIYGKTRVFLLPRRAGLASVLRTPAPLVLVLSPSLRVTGVNDALLSVLRLGKEELVGRRIWATPLGGYLGRSLMGKIREGHGAPFPPEVVECHVGDTRIIFRVEITTLSGPRGPAGTVVSLEDITATALHRQRIEEIMDGGTLSLLSSHPRILGDLLRRREEEERLRLVEASVDQAAVPALWTGPDGHILRANRAAAMALGYSGEELAGMSYPDLDPDHPEGGWGTLWDTLVKEGSARFDGRFRTKDGRTLAVGVTAGHVGHAGRECGFFLAHEPGNGRGAGEALRRANERLNLLTAVTRHDALNDIAALSMYLELMGGEQAGGAGPAVPPEKLIPLVHSLRRRMEFTGDYAGLGAKEPGWEDVAGAVGRAVAGMDLGGLRLDLELQGLEVYADPLFERAVANLVDNTLRHGEHARRLRFLARPEGDGCTLVVEDDGAGIPAGMKEDIFQPGFGRHTGLGLYLIREILGITGMSIDETGEPREGARFEIHVPAGGFRLKGGASLPGDVKMIMETRRTV